MTMITPSYLGETIEYSSLHACRSTLEDPTSGTVMSASGHTGAVAGSGVVLLEVCSAWFPHISSFSGEWALPAAMSGVKVG